MSDSVTLSNALTHRMNYLVARQGLISSNIANANTPGYAAQDISFEKLTANSHGRVPAGEIITDTSSMNLNGNSVQLDTEMVKLNDVQLQYRLNTQLYTKYAAMQRLALGRQ